MSQPTTPTTPPAKEPNPCDISRAAKQGLEDIIRLNNLDSAIVGPSNIDRAQVPLKTWESASKDPEKLIALASEMHRRVFVDTKYAEALKRMEELTAIEFTSGYGDYLASSLQEVQKSLRRLAAVAPDFAGKLGQCTPNEALSLPQQVQEKALAFYKRRIDGQRSWLRLHSEQGVMETTTDLSKGEASGGVTDAVSAPGPCWIE
ncbi:uncharacterized protein TRIREDRAFT_107358 [Trichoderma reesei QM6a]|jgi:hypothetical protein|uniref:Predicted protein n=2 Tax=Hypocrea jecorina TaxID=51453 RepID=G0RJF9_HYPJQ|nr:uncharacterized protein TRIREDRAFT_107358 [Trichoderma reesei QM6a]EGR48749.1 predicted protein [Trichoderma reesei QM6a]ETS01485.1 hypothetical protein M419DRAFT_80396 [Trichoderma reesei RUT C-30]